MIDNEKQIVDKMTREYFTCLSLRIVGRKNKMSYEWVRILLERNGINIIDIRKAIRDYKEWNNVEKRYRKCDCGKHYILNAKRRRANRLIHKCSECFIKIRDKYDGYKRQKEWALRNPEKTKLNVRKQGKKYQERHREELKRKARERYHRNKRKSIKSSK